MEKWRVLLPGLSNDTECRLALTIAHLSDLHLSPEFGRTNIRLTKRILRSLVAAGVDHIVVTGDITADAEARELEIARGIFAAHGLLDPHRLTVVIGNHDVFGGVHRAEDILSFPRKCRTTDYDAKVAAFREAFKETFQQSVVVSQPGFFPFVKVLGSVVLIGVNTIARYSGVNNPLGSNGEIDDDQARRLERILLSPLFEKKTKIVLQHHHFSRTDSPTEGAMGNIWGTIERRTMKLRRKKRLARLYSKAGVDLVLHGHIHQSDRYVRYGIQCVNGGGTLYREGDSALSVPLIRVDAGGITLGEHRVESEGRGRGSLAGAAETVLAGAA
jgi:3',5'-cyclic AMP phosphodiesterase CpdA